MDLQGNFADILDARENLIRIQETYFYNEVLFSWRWWVLIAIGIMLWVMWIYLVDKAGLFVILFVGLSACLIATVLDDIGLSLLLWAYPYEIAPYLSKLTIVDMSIIPVGYMLLYQYAKTWGNYILFLLLLSLFAMLIAEPIFEKLNLYVLIHWKFMYSVPIYIAIGLTLKWLADTLKKMMEKHREANTKRERIR